MEIDNVMHLRRTALLGIIAAALYLGGCPTPLSPRPADAGAQVDAGTFDGDMGLPDGDLAASQDGTALNCTKLSDQCNNGVAVSGKCVKVPKTGSCSDGDSCTDNDTCSGGKCVGKSRDCSKVKDQCNKGVCDKGACKKVPITGACNDNNSCTENDTCRSGVCEGTKKKDDQEPNDTYPGKKNPGINSCPGTAKWVTGAAYPATDVDWYNFTYFYKAVNCPVWPKMTLTSPSTTATFQICAFHKGKTCTGSGKPSCLKGTAATYTTSTETLKGCCASGKAPLKMETKPSNLSCGSFFVYVRVKPLGGATCQEYKISYKNHIAP